MRPYDEELLRTAIEVARAARANGNHPFGAVLADGAGNVLLRAENTVVTGRDATGHAETNLVRLATASLDGPALASATLYTSTEPCAMCAGAIYWAGLRRVVFALDGADLRALCPPGGPEMTLSCREVFARCGHPVEVEGPLLEVEAAEVHAGFWG